MTPRAARNKIFPGLAIVLLAAAALPACGQASGVVTASSLVMLSSAPATPSEVVREIDDPPNGTRWMLLRDASHPGGPGRWVPVAAPAPVAAESTKSEEIHAGSATPVPLEEAQLAVASVNVQGTGRPPALSRPIVRTGDRLVVEEHTSVADARLEAVALAPAAAGTTLNVRLKIGGKVVRAMVLDAGHATLQADTEMRP